MLEEIDVHRDFVVATIASTDSRRVTSYQTRKFQTMRYDLENLLKWLIEKECEHVCMESTGKYWIPVFNVLEPFCQVMLANVVSDIFGKSAQAIVTELLKTLDGSEVDFEPLLKRKLKEKSEMIAQSLQGTVSHEQAQKLKSDQSRRCLSQTFADSVCPGIPTQRREIAFPGSL